jgi:hypothetical protein
LCHMPTTWHQCVHGWAGDLHRKVSEMKIQQLHKIVDYDLIDGSINDLWSLMEISSWTISKWGSQKMMWGWVMEKPSWWLQDHMMSICK